MQAFNLLMGRDADLLKLDIPELDFEFAFGQGISIFPGVLNVDLGGTFSAYANLDFGFDTYGIRKFKESGDFVDVFDGFYVDDHVVNGVDQPEVTFTAGLNAGAFVGAVLVAAEVSGGIIGTVSADLCDIDPDGTFDQFEPDGRIRPSEMAQLISYDPFAFFDLSGSIDYYFNAWAGVGVIVDLGFVEIRETVWEESWNLASGTLVEFKLATPYPDQDPVLAHIVGSELILHTGRNASLRKHGNTTDGDENFTVSYSSAADRNDDDENDYLLVSGMGGTQQFLASEVTKIVAYGDAGDDTFLLTVDVPADIKVLIRGGEGDDVIKAYGGSTYLDPYPNGQSYGLYGDAGNDQLLGGDYNDTLNGGEGDDKLLGGGGDDRLVGGAGSDYLRGDGGNDILYGDADDIRMLAGSGHDTLIVTGGVTGTTRPMIDGGSGDDTIIAEYANLDIIGGYGRNSLTITRDDGTSPATITLARSPAGGDSGSLTGASTMTYSGINEPLTVKLGGLGDTLTVKSTPDMPLSVEGGGGGDRIYVESIQAPTTVNLTAAGDDTVTLGRNGSLQFLEHNVTVQGGSTGNDQLIYDNSSDPSNHLGEQVDQRGRQRSLWTAFHYRESTSAYDVAVDTVEVRLGGGSDAITVPDLARHVVIRGGEGADTVTATLVDVVGRLDTHDVEIVYLSDDRSAVNPNWTLDETGLSADGAVVLTTSNAVESYIKLSNQDDTFTVDAVGHKTQVEMRDGVDNATIGNLSATGAALILAAGDDDNETLTIDDSSRANSGTGTIAAGSITGFGMVGSVTYAEFETLDFQGSDTDYALTLQDTSVPTTVTLGSGTDSVTVVNTSHASAIGTGGGNDRVTIHSASAPLTLSGSIGYDVLIYAPPAGAADDLELLDPTDGNQGASSPNVAFNGLEEIHFALPDSNDALELDYTFPDVRVEIAGNGGNDTVTARQIGGTVSFASGSGYDTVAVQGTGDPTTHFTKLTFEPGLELLKIDNSGSVDAVDWYAASGGIYVEQVDENHLIINNDAARETKILAGSSGVDTLTVQEAANRTVDATIDGNYVELVSGALVLSPGSFLSDDPADDDDFTYTLGTLDGVADVATFGEFVYTASAGDDTVAVFEDLGEGELQLRQIFKEGLDGIDSLEGVSRIVVSEDGMFVYVSAVDDNAITVFSRDADTGLLSFMQVVRDGIGAWDGEQGDIDLALSSNALYVAVPGDNSLVVFAVEQDGRLAFTEAIPNTPSENVAYLKSAQQSSTYNTTYSGADRAVDGNTDPIWQSNTNNSISCTNPRWRLVGGRSRW